MRKHTQAFTLVEMAIVLVIIGLVIGGIFAGQNMIQAQRVRQVLADAKTYATAIQQFQDKYGALPGDMRDAERIFGNAEGGAVNTDCATPTTSASPDGIKTCNGNGDGLIDITTNAYAEGYWAWQQLKAAGFITGNYTGIRNSGGGLATPGVNIPAGAIPNSGYYLHSYGISTGVATFFAGDYNNVMQFGGQKIGLPNMPVFTPAEAYGIDQKVDDGVPGTGSVTTYNDTWYSGVGISGACITASNDPTVAAYVLSGSSVGCVLLFTEAFDSKK